MWRDDTVSLLEEVILIRPLTRTTAGKPYYRPQEVETEILGLLSLGIDERMEKLAPTSPSGQTVRPETLVYFLREEARSNHDGRFRVLYDLVMRRYLAFFRPADRQVGGVTHTDGALDGVRQHASERFVEKVLTDRTQGDDRLDIYEVKFGLAAAKDRLSARKAVFRHLDREEMLNPLEDGPMASPEVEAAAARLANAGDTTKTDVSDYRKSVLAVIDTLPDKYRRVATMTMNNIPIEASDADAASISRIVGCTPKTARTRRDRAIQMIQDKLGLEALT